MPEATLGELLKRHRENPIHLEPIRDQLTQKQLGKLLGYDNTTISRYERGELIPSAEYLQQFIQVLNLLDDETQDIWAAYQQFSGTSPAALRQRREDWGEAPDVSIFYGRYEDLVTLTQWLVADQCCLIALLGMGGIGKTALAIKLAKQTARHFDWVIWRSLRNAPPLDEILAECIQFLSDQQEIDLPHDTEKRITRLIDYLDQQRCLVVLDNVEAILQEGQAGHYRAGYEDYGRLFQRAGEGSHQSCLLLTSREKPREVGQLEGDTAPVRSHQLSGLNLEEGQQILTGRGLIGSDKAWAHLVNHYSGNPLALSLVAEMIREVYDGDIDAFIADGEVIFGRIGDVIREQFERLSALEQSLMYWLAIEREPVPREVLLDDLVEPVSKRELMVALRSLRRRSLIEKSGSDFTLQNVVMEYVTERLIEQVCEEIMAEDISLFISHALIKAQAKEYVRESQTRLIFNPVADRLRTVLGEADIADKLMRILSALREAQPRKPGYGAGNTINLLSHLDHVLRDFDFSHLVVWQAYLQGINLHDVNFAYADLTKSVFTDRFGSGNVIAFNPDGGLLASGSSNGQVRIWDAKDGKLLSVCEGHPSEGSVWALSFSPNGRHLASGSRDRTIRLWDIKTGRSVRIFRESERVFNLKFSPNSHLLASDGGGQDVSLWDVERGQRIRTLQGHTGFVRSIAFSPDGLIIASGSEDNTIRLWETDTGICLCILAGHTGRVNSIVFSPDGRILVSGSYDKTVRLWDVSTRLCIRTLHGHIDAISTVALSPDGGVLASSSHDNTTRLWEPNIGLCLHILQGHSKSYRSVTFSPDGSTLADISSDQTVRLWNVKTGRLLKALKGHSSHIWSVVFNPDGQTIATGSDDQTVRIWETDTGRCHKIIHGYSNMIFPFLLSSDCKLMATGHEDQSARLWDIDTGKCIRILPGHTQWVWALAFSPDNCILASGSFDSTIRVWDVNTGNLIKILEGHTEAVTRVLFSHSGAFLASTSRIEGIIQLWEVNSGRCLHTFHRSAPELDSIAFSPGDELLVSNDLDQKVHIWNTTTGQHLRSLEGHTGKVTSVSFSPGGILATSSQDRTIRLWDVKIGRCIKILEGHSDWVSGAIFSPNGSMLASRSPYESVRLWDTESGRCLQTFDEHKGAMLSCSFSSDGRMLATGNSEHTVYVWDVETGDRLNILRGHTSRVWSVKFGANDNILASASADESIRFWNPQTGVCLITFRVDRPYERMNITGVTGLTEAQKASLKALGAIEEDDNEWETDG